MLRCNCTDKIKNTFQVLEIPQNGNQAPATAHVSRWKFQFRLKSLGPANHRVLNAA